MPKGRKSSRGTITDLLRIIRARQASKRDDYRTAVRLLEGEPASSRYSHLIPLYRLTLMVCAEDNRRVDQARLLFDQQGSAATGDDRCLDAYRRYLCGGLLGNWQVSEAAANELRHIPISGFYRGLLALPS